ncbi:MAG: [FeFe] hydrogenase H-cluster maturation GTPase HydF [Clostridia bacterium]|nr:[FeFe] hydrogenase H-cluster maturation GTPase HydF [Clostridia bacterium]
MSLNETVTAERVHIGFFGRRNVGKSSLVNAVTGQNLSIVSEVKGTTTDPVRKAMELLPIGPVSIIDTPGFDDEGALGELRVEKTLVALRKTDVAVLVADAAVGLTEADETYLSLFRARKMPFIVAYNKADCVSERKILKDNELYVSAKTGENVAELKELLGKFALSKKGQRKILADLVAAGDVVVLVIPVDESAPKGRLILPQQQTLRELLDLRAAAICCQPTELKGVLAGLSEPPKLVVTDSQAFGEVSKIVDESVPLTSFSILFARYKGDLETLIGGAKALSELKDGDKVLISEGCTHHRQCNDIGTVKLPSWIRDFAGADLDFSFTSGGDFPSDLKEYALIVHCGGCMLNETEMKARLSFAREAGVPIVNYGVAIAHIHGILKRSLAPLALADPRLSIE